MEEHKTTVKELTADGIEEFYDYLSKKTLMYQHKCFTFMVSQRGFEPPTPGLEGPYSIQLSYWPIS